MLFAISMPRSGAVGGGFCCGAAVISRARPAFRRTPARLWIRKYTYQFRHSFVELITAADDHTDARWALRRHSYPLQAAPEIPDRLTEILVVEACRRHVKTDPLAAVEN